MKTGLICVFASLMLSGTCSAAAKSAHHGVPHGVTGTAVYYNDKMNGKTLAMKGEKYDSNGLTAATHSAFPLGSSVKVTNLSNNKTVTVKVNDRMNPKSKAVVDLSRKAAEELDLVHAGHTRVRVEPAS